MRAIATGAPFPTVATPSYEDQPDAVRGHVESLAATAATPLLSPSALLSSSWTSRLNAPICAGDPTVAPSPKIPHFFEECPHKQTIFYPVRVIIKQTGIRQLSEVRTGLNIGLPPFGLALLYCFFNLSRVENASTPDQTGQLGCPLQIPTKTIAAIPPDVSSLNRTPTTTLCSSSNAAERCAT